MFPVGHGQDLLFRLVDGLGDVFFFLIATGRHFCGRIDQLPAQGLLFHDLGMVHHIGGRGHGIAEGGDSRCPADGIQLPHFPQLFSDGDQIHRLVAAVEIHDGRKDDPVIRTVKIVF